MDDRRCLHCRRKIHPALRPDAKFCGRSCKSSYHRDRKATPPDSREPRSVTLSPAMGWLAGIVRSLAPSDAVGFQLHRDGSPEGNGHFVFPVPGHKSKRANGSLSSAPLYHLHPFEPPRIPWVGSYTLWFWSSERGLVRSDVPDGQTVFIGADLVTPRAAFDKEAVWLEGYSPGDSDLGSPAYLQREIIARAPAQAIGYHLTPLQPAPGWATGTFPPCEQFSRRSNGGISDVPYYLLHPFEPPCVPWLGEYRLSFELADRVLYVPQDPAAQIVVVGFCFPHNVPKLAKFTPFPALPLPMHGRELLVSPTTKPARKLLRGKRGQR